MVVPKLTLQKRKQIAEKRRRNADGTFAKKNAGMIGGAVYGGLSTALAHRYLTAAAHGAYDEDVGRWDLHKGNPVGEEISKIESETIPKHNHYWKMGGLTRDEHKKVKDATISGAIEGTLVGAISGKIVDSHAKTIKSKASPWMRGVAIAAGNNLGRRVGLAMGNLDTAMIGGLIGGTAAGLLHNKYGASVQNKIENTAKKSSIGTKALNHIKKYAPAYTAATISMLRTRKENWRYGGKDYRYSELSSRVGKTIIPVSNFEAFEHNFYERYAPAAKAAINAQIVASHARKIGVNTYTPESIVQRYGAGELGGWSAQLASNYLTKAWQSSKLGKRVSQSIKSRLSINKNKGKRK